MSPLTRALRDELVALLRTDAELRRELRAALAGAEDDQLLTVSDAAAVARVSAATVRRWIGGGELPATGSGKRRRIARADLVALLQRGGRAPITSALSPEELADLEDRAVRP